MGSTLSATLAAPTARAVLRGEKSSQRHYSGGRSGYLLVSETQLNNLLIAMVFCNGQLLIIQLTPRY